MEPFYYNHMNKNQQAAYRAMQQGLTNLSDEFQIPRLEGKDLSNVFFELRLDHPEIFWASGFKYKYYPDSPNLILIPEYLFDKGKIREHQKAMDARVEKLARPAMKLTELEKERYIHDFICEHVHYDKLKKPYSHEIIGPLGQGVGVERARLRRDLRALEIGDGLGVPDIDRGRVASAIVAAAAAGEARHAEHDSQEDGYDSSDVCLHFLHLLSE